MGCKDVLGKDGKGKRGRKRHIDKDNERVVIIDRKERKMKGKEGRKRVESNELMQEV